MKDKVVFFILGALLATIAYFAGDLETLTAQDKITELDHLRVNHLQVKDAIMVGDIGKKFILISADNEFAGISLHGAEVSETRDNFINNIGDAPVISLEARGNAAVIKAGSHSERPEAICVLGLIRMEGKKYESSLIIQDSDGTNSVFSD